MTEIVRRFSKLATVVLLVATVLIVHSRLGHSTLGLVLALAVLFAGLVTSMFTHVKMTPEDKTRNFRFLLGIRRPEETRKRILQFVAFLICFFGPMLFFLYILPKYVLLDERLYYQLGYVIFALFGASFVIPALNRTLRDYPLWMNLAGRLGFCIPAVAALFSLALAFNCVNNNSVRTRDMTCLGRRTTLGSNPIYYIRVRPWRDTDRTVEVEVTRQVFAATRLDANLRITTGVGRLGIEWIRRIDVAQPTSDETQ